MGIRNSSASLFFSVLVFSLCCSQAAYSETAPCSLLTQNQVSADLGVSVGAGSPIANTGCSWQSTGAPKVTVTVSMFAEKMFNGAKTSSAPNMTKTAISGIGDEAIFIGMQGFSTLWVRKGTTCAAVRR